MALALKQAREGLRNAWENLAEGWRDLASRSGRALTRFIPRKPSEDEARPAARAPAWGLVSGDMLETTDSIVVQIEIPGVDKKDCNVEVDGRTLRVRGEKHHDSDYVARNYLLTERAYGVFERTILLPPNADGATARASYHNGVLSVEMRKRRGRPTGKLVVK